MLHTYLHNNRMKTLVKLEQVKNQKEVIIAKNRKQVDAIMNKIEKQGESTWMTD